MRLFSMAPHMLHKLWKPRGSTNTEIDNHPKCGRCSKRWERDCAIEAHEIRDAGRRRIEVVGRCRGVCHFPQQDGQLPEEWDAVRITWDRLSDRTSDEQLDTSMPSDLKKQIAAIVFFPDVAEDV